MTATQASREQSLAGWLSRVAYRIALKAQARAFGLDFVPVAEEPYDLVTTAATLAAGVLDPLLDLIGDAGFIASVEALGGYSTAQTGRRIR